MKKAIADPDEAFFEVEEILQKKITNGKIMYKVKWKGYHLSQSTWEPLENLSQVVDMIQEFEEAGGRSDEERTPATSRKKAKPRGESKPEVPTKVVNVKEDRGNLVWTVETASGQTEVRPLAQLRSESPQLLIDFLLSKIKFV